MTVQEWLRAAQADAERRGLVDLKPLLETLAQATAALREAAFEDDSGLTAQRSRLHD
ncbi:MAG: hypothetical protein HYS05_19955 [Acidobacteria bacterium]|nr:hypothetical protein [Acidobacteriota bacterium]